MRRKICLLNQQRNCRFKHYLHKRVKQFTIPGWTDRPISKIKMNMHDGQITIKHFTSCHKSGFGLNFSHSDFTEHEIVMRQKNNFCCSSATAYVHMYLTACEQIGLKPYITERTRDSMNPIKVFRVTVKCCAGHLSHS